MLKNANTKTHKAAIIVALMFTSFAPVNQHTESADEAQMHQVFNATVQELNHMGRVNGSGKAAGMVNNLWQTVRHPSNPEALGCGGQAEYLKAKLLADFPTWTFESRYEYGIKSPIVLPHQWLTAHGPHGETITVDPWQNKFEKE